MIIDAFNYKAWADQRVLQAIEHVVQTADLGLYEFMLQQLNHIVIVEDLFRARLLNAPPPHESTNTEIVPEFGRLKLRMQASGKWYLNYASNLSAEGLRDSISFTFADGKRGSMSVEEILFHIVNHASYHRGSIAHSLDQTGVPHPPDGYGIYIHETEPNRRNET